MQSKKKGIKKYIKSLHNGKVSVADRDKSEGTYRIKFYSIKDSDMARIIREVIAEFNLRPEKLYFINLTERSK